MNGTNESATTPAPQRTRIGPTSTDALLVTMVTIWAVNLSVIKAVTAIVPPLAFNGVRIALAAGTQIALARALRLATPVGKDTTRLLALGMLGNGVYQVLFILGMSRTRVATAALILASQPALTALVARIHGSERLPSRAWLGIGLQVAGVSTVVLETTGTTNGTDSFVGGLLILSAALSWAVYAVLLRPHSGSYATIQLGAYTMLGGAVVAVLVGWRSIGTVDWGALPLGVWGAVVYSGLFALGLAYIFWFRGVRLLGPTRVATYSNLQPIIALLVAWATLGEHPTLWQIAGGASIITGLVITRS
jgi:drug/metabolite transporter (DMT)-like permease